jgi:hypothetical protein
METLPAKPEPRRRDIVLACALVLGLLADQLVRVPGRPGLNVALWAVAGTAVLWLLTRRLEMPVSRETRWLIGGAVLFAFLLMVRDAEPLAVFCLFSAVVLLGLGAGRAALPWARRAQIADVAASAARVGALVVGGPVGWNVGAARQPALPAAAGVRSPVRYARTIARGTLMALLPLLVLTQLLADADPVFERVLRDALFTDIGPLFQHLFFAAVIAWFVSGYLRAFLIGDEEVMAHVRLPRPAVSPAEIAFALSLINVLFIVFLVVQVRYLFGGASLVQVTAGLTYAEYARRGFFELIAAAAFVVPVLLVADWAAAKKPVPTRLVLRGTSTLLVVLLTGVLGSAAYRMKLYQAAYGLTEDRLYASVFMVWLTGVLVWLAVTVLRGRRRGFAFGAIAGGLACIAALHALNPHALIARVNISRAASGAEVDGRYLSTLSADAVPTLVARLRSLPVSEQCLVHDMFEKRWTGERKGGWRTWNVSDARARKLVQKVSRRSECAAVAPPASVTVK